jgi:tellurite resistance protein TerA
MVVELKKGGRGVVLEKKPNQSLGKIIVNLNWNQNPQQPQKKGFFESILGSSPKGIDLDLGCLFEMKDGKKGGIQALGTSFGSFDGFPFIQLDKDDRTGSSTDGENIFINGNKVSEIKRVLLYTFIYEGVPNWAQTDGIVTIKPSTGENITIKLDEHDNSKTMCALALLENVKDETFGIERIVKYYRGHQEMDKAFNWGLKWTSGRKD